MMFLIAMLGLAGLLSYRGLGRAEDPSFTIKVVIVSATWPGASAADMQDQVADPIEKKLQELPYIDKVTTYTKPGFTAIGDHSTPPLAPGSIRAPSLVGRTHMFSCGTIASEKRISLPVLRSCT